LEEGRAMMDAIITLIIASAVAIAVSAMLAHVVPDRFDD
jgi:hypothetical protein